MERSPLIRRLRPAPPQAMSGHTSAVDDTAWRLFSDWCEAVDACPLPATVATISDFFDQVPAAEPTLRARLRAIRAAHQQAGEPLRVAHDPRPNAWRSGPGWLPLGAALARCEVGGWPRAARGRRDAFLLVCIGMAHLTRTQTVRLSVDDITWPTNPTTENPILIGRTPIRPATDDPARCPACALTRWLRVAAEAASWSRASVRQMLASAPATTPTVHDCTEPAPRGWREVWQLAPAIDQHGWMTDWRPMSTRAVSAVLADRLADGTPPPKPAPPVERPEWEQDDPDDSYEPRRHIPEAELWDLLEAKVKAADDTNARISALLDDAENLLGSLSNPAPPDVSEDGLGD